MALLPVGELAAAGRCFPSRHSHVTELDPIGESMPFANTELKTAASKVDMVRC